MKRASPSAVMLGAMRVTTTLIRQRRGPLPDYYRILGVPKSASAREIEDSYWRRAFRAPSRRRRRSTRALMLRLNEAAYEILGSPEVRAAYDAKRAPRVEAREERNWLRTLLRLSAGQTLAEYGLIIGVVGVGVVALAMNVFSENPSGAFTGVINCVTGSCS
jgi:Flp pilus assembly pilin Flp